MKLPELLKECAYMPVELRDFHDQKDLFKLIFSRVNMCKELDGISRVQAHIFVVDVFLYFMAKRGYTLQKSRHKCDFNNLQEELKDGY